MAGRAGGGRRPRAVFMAFGTQGDVFPIAVCFSSFTSPAPPLAADFWRQFCFLLLHLLLSRQNTPELSSGTRFSLEGCAFNLIPSAFVL